MNKLQELIRQQILEVIQEFNVADYSTGNDSVVKTNLDTPNASSSYLMTVEKSPAGIETIKKLKADLAPFFKFRLRGRHENRKEVLGTKYRPGTQNDIPIDQAQYIAIYLDPK